jgi:hypothetical protein
LATGNRLKFHQSFIVFPLGTIYTKYAQAYLSTNLMKALKALDRTAWFIVSLCVPFATVNSTKAAWAQMIEPPPGQPAPQSTTSGGTCPIASTCLQQPKQSTPFTEIASSESVELTMHNRPTVCVYVPPTYAKTLEFSLFDQNRKGIYQTSIEIDERTGFIPISLPSSAPASSQNQPYYWIVALVCDAGERTNDWITGGWIQQKSIDPVLQQRLSQAKLIEQIRLAVKSGYWYEAVDTYLRSQQAKPSNPQISKVWEDLLESENLKGRAFDKSFRLIAIPPQK